MKRIIFSTFILLAFSISSFATIVIVVKGSGGLISDGTTHKVCPVKDVTECAKISMPPSSVSNGEIAKGTKGELNFQGRNIQIELLKNVKTNSNNRDIEINGFDINFKIIE